MNQTPKAGAFSRQRFASAVREEAASLIGAVVIGDMSVTAFKNYAKHHNNGTLFAGWIMTLFFVGAFSFIVRNIIRAARHDKAAEQ